MDQDLGRRLHCTDKSDDGRNNFLHVEKVKQSTNKAWEENPLRQSMR